MKRKVYAKLLEWKHKSNGKTALMVDGARCVVKSWIVEEFAKNKYEDYLMVDLNGWYHEPFEGRTDGDFTRKFCGCDLKDIRTMGLNSMKVTEL